MTDEAMELLKSYAWPGNVREVRNVVERSLVISPHDAIGSAYLPERIKRHLTSRQQISIPIGLSSLEVERMLILHTLASAGNNKAKAAKILGVRVIFHVKLLTLLVKEDTGSF